MIADDNETDPFFTAWFFIDNTQLTLSGSTLAKKCGYVFTRLIVKSSTIDKVKSAIQTQPS
jgi:hypothetical protein